ncbi:hypothetical protein BDV10DRAFT_160929 [Aspergillus recurvatus]
MLRTVRCPASGAQSVKVLEKRLGLFQGNIATYAGLPAETQIQACSRSQSPTWKMKARCPRRGSTLHRSNITASRHSLQRLSHSLRNPCAGNAMDVANIPAAVTPVASRSSALLGEQCMRRR